MIIRNPYGFIVKHYRIINFLLLIPMVYLLFVFGDIATFFKDYIRAGYVTPESNIVDNYIPSFTALILFGVLIANLVIWLLLTLKKKKNIYHIANVLYTVFLLVGLVVFSSTMSTIERGQLDATLANFIKDFASMCSLPMYVLLVMGAINVVGFNIKTFRLDKHAELRVAEEDEEEIEIKVGSDNYSTKRGLVRVARELKYYVIENKFVFTCIFIAIALAVAYNSYTNYQLYHKSYTINQAFVLDNFSLSLKESYITNLDYRGRVIAKDKYYLAVKIGIHNQGGEAIIQKSNFRLHIGDDIVYPSYDRAIRFIDIGKNYQGETIYANEAHDYVFVYELTKDQVKSQYELRILNGLNVKDTKLISKYKKIKIRPLNILKSDTLGVVKLNQKIDLKNSTLGNTKYTLKSFTVKPTYKYTYEVCNKKKICSTYIDNIVPSGNKVLAIIEDEIIYDESSSYYLNSDKDFYGDFITVKYTIETESGTDIVEKKGQSLLKNITPRTLEGKKVYEVPTHLLNAKKISLFLKVRDKEYEIIVKDD